MLFLRFIQKGKQPIHQDMSEEVGGITCPLKHHDSLQSCDNSDSAGLGQGLTKKSME